VPIIKRIGRARNPQETLTTKAKLLPSTMGRGLATSHESWTVECKLGQSQQVTISARPEINDGEYYVVIRG